jgi:Protein of unknown function (DUF2480)
MEDIVNKVANSGLVQIDLETLYPSGERVVFDLKDLLYEGLLLREKDFRAFIKTHAWENYTGKHIAITCSTDAIVPTWAYMLLSIHLAPYAQTVVFGTLSTLEQLLFSKALQQIDLRMYQDAKVVVKGCSKQEVPLSAYVELSKMLRPVVSSLMFGEPCSTVPLYKRKA